MTTPTPTPTPTTITGALRADADANPAMRVDMIDPAQAVTSCPLDRA